MMGSAEFWVQNKGMNPSGHLWALVLLLMLLWSCKTSVGDPRTALVGLYCNSTVASSTLVFANNAAVALNNLSTLVGQNGFGKVVVGDGPNVVFGLVQCMEDLSSVDCTLCFSMIRTLQPKCFPGVEGSIFLDGCFGRYANFSFFNQALDSWDTKVCSYSQNTSNPNAFVGVVRAAVGTVTTAAPSNRGFAVGSASGSGLNVYALAQCWETLDNASCSTCLDAAASAIVSCSPATEGRSLYAGCYMRYSTQLFWNTNQTASSSSGIGKGKIIGIILGSSFGAFLLIVGIVIWKKRGFWSKVNAKSLRELYGPALFAAFAHSNLNFRYNKLRQATDNFSLSNKLGQGSYGIVYKAILSDGKEVAVKRLFLNTKQWVDRFLNEVDLINRVRHKNLVKLLGCSVDGPESLLVYEYFCNRSLDLFIFDATQEKHLDWQQRFDIIRGVAEGLSYLHDESETPIIHRDIKASNILLDEKFKPRITDFGLARFFPGDQTHISTAIAGTLGYMAPEYVVHGHLSVKADVYSFGILILEIVTGKRCTSAIGSHAGHFLLAKIWNHYKANTVDKIIDESLIEVGLKDEIMYVMQVGLFCTQADPHLRPTMSRVVELLRSSRSEEDLILTDPPFLDVDMVDAEDVEVSRLLAANSAPGLSTSSEYGISGR